MTLGNARITDMAKHREQLRKRSPPTCLSSARKSPVPRAPRPPAVELNQPPLRYGRFSQKSSYIKRSDSFKRGLSVFSKPRVVSGVGRITDESVQMIGDSAQPLNFEDVSLDQLAQTSKILDMRKQQISIDRK